jgi:hypothetical protein
MADEQRINTGSFNKEEDDEIERRLRPARFEE